MKLLKIRTALRLSALMITVGSVSPTPAAVTTPPTSVNYEGMWAVPNLAEAGWGINFTHQADVILASWFTYGQSGISLWFTMTAQQQDDGSFTGNIDLTAGPALDAVPFDPTEVTYETWGSGRLQFTDADHANFTYTVDGVTQSKSLARFQFASPMPICTFGSSTPPEQATNYQGMWVVPNLAEAGWGINFTHQGDTIFASWFTYNRARRAIWLSATLARTGARTYAGPLEFTRGPPWDSVSFDPTKIQHDPQGMATVTFTDGANATFSYTLPAINVSQTKSLSRFVFRAPGTVCQ